MTPTRMAALALTLGMVSVAGTTSTRAACSNDTPTVTTNKSSYGESEAISISGCGFGYDEPLSVLVKGPDGRTRSVAPSGNAGPLEWTADERGGFDIGFEFPATDRRSPKAGEHGRFTVTVLTPSGLALAAAAFERTAESTTDPDFFWLPPTVPSAAPFTGPFDAGALEDLVVEVCELDSNDDCVDGPPIERFTSATLPVPSRIALNEAGEFYTLRWLTGTSRVNRDLMYRVRVFKDGIAISSIDVDFVQNTPELALVDPLRAIGVVLGQQLTLRFRVQQPTARTRVTINEVESNGGVPGDWIELYNSAPVPVSLAGYILKDNDDTHIATLPEGAEIPAKGHYVVEDPVLGFGLGANDAARFFTPDGSVLVDSYAWAAHAVTTYGRCPNGSGAFQVNTTSTKGAANDCSIVIRINEVESNGGTPGDWVELYNPGPAPANLKGFVLSDGEDAHAFAIPPVVVPAGNFLVLDEAAFGFSLDDADAVRLVRPDGSLADAFAWAQRASTTYGRCPSGSGDFATTLGATRGAVNNCFVPVTTLHINEVESSGGVPGDWVELVNTGAGAIDLSGWRFLDNDDTHTAYVVPAGTTIAPGGYLVLEESGFGFGLGAAETVRLFDPTGALYESYAWTAHALTTYGRCPNGVGAFQATTTVTKGAANDCSVVIRINEVESSGGTPGDWIELFNPGAGPANLAGFIVKDNDNTHVYAIPGGVVVAPGGYYVVEEGALGFGLGANDSARIFDPAGGLVDSYAWTEHAPNTTYGRCPNGAGAFAVTTASSKGAANVCEAPITTIHINEVESNGGVPGDWFELINTGANAVNMSGWKMLDNDDTHTAYVFPAGTIVPAGGFLVVEEAQFVFGLGANDSVRLFDAGGTLYESYAWPTHAPVSYGRCPDGSGPFVANSASTKGAANNCGNPVKINEIESDLGVPGDWIELYNPAPSPVDISGLVLRDNDDTHTYTIPAGTVVPGGGYHVVDDAALGFGLGGQDSVRLFEAGVVLDAYSWLAHATTTYGRCPNGTGDFVATTSATKGGVNACPGDASPWPGDAAVTAVDGANTFGGNLSGLAYEGSGATAVMWAARNGPESLFRLLWDGAIWKPDTANNWGAGKQLRYPDGTGRPDAEDVTYTDAGAGGGLYVATERDNGVSATSHNSVLRFDVTGNEVELTATHEWNLTADLPVTGANLGLEAITWIPDAFLVASGLLDESTGLAYDPAQYPLHGGGLFFVGLEANGMIRAYALNGDGTFSRIATITSGFAGVMALHFDRQTNDLWVVCDDTCDGKSAVFGIDPISHKFTVVRTYARPAGMPNLNNEGFTIAPLAECVSDRRPAFWADDSETGTHAIRRGMVSCAPAP